MIGFLKFLLLLGLVALSGCVGTVGVPSGSTGAAGTSSPGAGGSGTAGVTGTGGTGTAGTTGAAGTTGPAGTLGTAGTNGAAGTSGSAGTTGAAGTTSVGGRGGTTGTAGTTGAGGRGGAAGTGTAGSTGTAGTTGTGGGTACTITAQAAVSTAIPTVATVSWTTTLANVTSAEIDFGLPGGTTMVAPVEISTAPNYKTLLLGMKGGKSYTYRVVAKSGAGSCTSQDYTVMTGAIPGSVTKPTVSISMASAHDKGFIITSGGIMGTSTEILDADGEVVWWATGPSQNSRSHMSWNGARMYMMALNVTNNGTGKITSISMDGTGSTSVTGATTSHHDLTAIPGGLATPLWNKSGTDAPCSIVEFADPSWATTTVIADVGTVYNSTSFHTNAIHYYASDNSYTIGDRNPNLYVKVSRAGSLIWQFGGTNPKEASKSFSGVTAWQVNHGHHLLADGTFLFFNNNANEAWWYKLNTSSMAASQAGHYTAGGATSNVLGDIQGLPNGNILVTFSTSGQIHEITPSGGLVMKITASAFGYSEFRESLYGPPPY